MTIAAAATKAMFNAIAKDSYSRIVDWFNTNPEQPFCYWSKDDFLPANYTESTKTNFLSRHPEIENLNDHTTVYYNNGTVILRTFCPRLRKGIASMIAEGYTSNVVGDISWRVEPEGENYKVIGIKK